MAVAQDNAQETAWFFLAKSNPLRRRLISLVGWRWFERIVILVIILNCIMLALFDPMDHQCRNTRCQVLEKLERFLFTFFLLEMLIKMTAMGLFGSRGYFADRWNLFDFIIVVTGIIEVSGTTGGFLTTVRLCRILRPLRAINRVPSIRILVNLLMDTIPMLGNVLILAFLVFACFGILGVQLFQGKLRNRCYWSQERNQINQSAVNGSDFPPFYIPTTGSIDFVCHLPDELGSRSCDQIPENYDYKICQTHYKLYDRHFPPNTTTISSTNTTANCLDTRRYYRSCRRDGPNPYYGSVSFDNFAMAFVFIYQIVTLEGWSDLMYLIQDAYSYHAWLYFVTLISIGSFFLVNLALVVITMQFSETKRREMRLIKQNRNFGSSQLSLYTDLYTMWKRICKSFTCFTKYFRSIHHIHQHVFVNQQTSLCDHCRQMCSTEESAVVTTVASPPKDVQIPKIEISQFDNEEMIPTCDILHNTTGVGGRGKPSPEYCHRSLAADQRSASFPGLNPRSLDLLSCASFQYSTGTAARGGGNSDLPISPDIGNSDFLMSPFCRSPTSPLSPCVVKPDVGVISPMTKTFRFLNAFDFNEKSIEEHTNMTNSQRSPLARQIPMHLLSPNGVNEAGFTPKTNNNYLRTNTFSLHADTSVTVRGSRSSSIKSRTSFALKINGEAIGASACVEQKQHSPMMTSPRARAQSYTSSSFNNETHHKPKPSNWGVAIAKRRFNSFSSSQTSATTDSSGYTCSDLGYGSVFDLRRCDKYYVSEVPSRYKQFRLFCNHLAESSRYSEVIMLIIVLNTICMAVEHNNEPERMTRILEILNLIFIWIFVIETVIKIFGVGFKTYFLIGFNCFDCAVVVLSVMELLINDTSSSGNFTVFRSLRLLRIFRLIRPMRHQIAVMLRTTSSVMTFFALLFLFMFTFAIMGMHIFGGKFVFKDKYGKMVLARSNFDSFVWATVTVFQILTQEDWNLVMYDGIRATNQWASVYFLSLMTIGYYVLFNLLVAILVEGFTTPLEKKRMTQHIVSILKSKANKKMLLKRTISLPDILISSNNKADAEKKTRNQADGASKNVRYNLPPRRFLIHNQQYGESTDESDDDSRTLSPLRNCGGGGGKDDKENKPILLAARLTCPENAHILEWRAERRDTEAANDESALLEEDSENNEAECCINRLFPKFTSYRVTWSLFMFPMDSKFRRYVMRMTGSKWFDGIILVFILYSCVLLALENPHKKMSPDIRFLIDVSMFIMTWIFFMEMMAKIVADGFVSGKGTYLRNAWNILDFILVMTSLIDVFLTLYFTDTKAHTDIIKGMRVFRATRALRPLRMIRRAPGLKLVVQTLLYSLKPIGNTVLIAIIFFIVFGIFGVQQLKGKLYYCYGVAANTVHNKTECTQHPDGVWLNYQYNFDNLPEALMTLFVVSTKDGWMDIMRRGIDARGINLEPRTNYAESRIFYFISFLLIGGFLVLNMIVGVVVENFQKCQELQDIQSNKARSVLQKWKHTIEQRRNIYWKTYPKWRKKVHVLCTHPLWDISITILICANVLILALEHYQMEKGFYDLMEVSNVVFTVIYIIEAVLLMTAISPRRYVKDRWNCFDLVIVIVSMISMLFDYLDGYLYNINPGIIRAMRFLRVVRVLKLLKMAKGLRLLLNHVGETMPQVTNLALLFSLLFFVYSCLGIQLFGTLECSKRFPCAGLGRHANFKTLGNSMLTLFRIATGDNWSGIMRDTLRSSCDNSISCTSNCCVSRYVSPLFFVSFVLFAQFVLVNILIAVLMKQLRVTRKRKKVKKNQNSGSRKKGAFNFKPIAFLQRKWEDCKKDSKRQSSRKSRDQSSIKLQNFTDNNRVGWHTLKKTITKQQQQPQQQQQLNKTLEIKPKSCTHVDGTCGRTRKKLLRKYSCPDKLLQYPRADKRKLNLTPKLDQVSSGEGLSLLKRRLDRNKTIRDVNANNMLTLKVNNLNDEQPSTNQLFTSLYGNMRLLSSLSRDFNTPRDPKQNATLSQTLNNPSKKRLKDHLNPNHVSRYTSHLLSPLSPPLREADEANLAPLQFHHNLKEMEDARLPVNDEQTNNDNKLINSSHGAENSVFASQRSPFVLIASKADRQQNDNIRTMKISLSDQHCIQSNHETQEGGGRNHNNLITSGMFAGENHLVPSNSFEFLVPAIEGRLDADISLKTRSPLNKIESSIIINLQPIRKETSEHSTQIYKDKSKDIDNLDIYTTPFTKDDQQRLFINNLGGDKTSFIDNVTGNDKTPLFNNDTEEDKTSFIDDGIENDSTRFIGITAEENYDCESMNLATISPASSFFIIDNDDGDFDKRMYDVTQA